VKRLKKSGRLKREVQRIVRVPGADEGARSRVKQSHFIMRSAHLRLNSRSS